MDKETWKTLSLERAVQIQTELWPGVIQSGNRKAEDFETVAGVDLAYWEEEDQEYAVCCIVVLEQKTRKVLESRSVFGKITVCIHGYSGAGRDIWEGSAYSQRRKAGLCISGKLY